MANVEVKLTAAVAFHPAQRERGADRWYPQDSGGGVSLIPEALLQAGRHYELR